MPALAAAVAAGLAALALVSFGRHRAAAIAPENCIIEGVESIGGPFTLVDVNGATVTQADFAGAPAVVYFGYAHCPDICPTAMYTLADALALPGGYDVQSILITVDPERDTPALLRDYVRSGGFPPDLVGLSGTVEQIEAAKRAFRVYAARAPIEGAAPGVYNVDHTSLAYVLDGDWRVRSVIRTEGATPEQYAQCIEAGLQRNG